MKKLLASIRSALSHIKKPIRLAGAVFVFVTLLVATAERATKADDDEHEASVIGSGRIGNSLQGTTIPSASDFGFAVSGRSGTFVCAAWRAPKRVGLRDSVPCWSKGRSHPAAWRFTSGTCHSRGLPPSR